MKWKLRRLGPLPPKSRVATHTGGAAAHKHAEASLANQRAQQPEVDRVAESLRQLRERNHFAAQLRMIFLGGTDELY